MKVKVHLRYLRISPRKVTIVADLIRRKKVQDALNLLKFLRKRAANPLKKLLESGIFAAKNDFKLDPSNLYVSKILVNEGPKLKRFRYKAKGRIHEIQKKTSHITLELDEIK